MPAPKLERLLNLTAFLLATRLPVSADEIQHQLDYPEDKGAFRRAFERDKEELRAMGIPLKVEPVPGTMPAVDGYRIPRDEYALRDPGLTTEELAALHLAASAVQVEGVSATPALLKLGGLVGAPAPEAGVRVAPLPSDPNLTTLFAAVADRRPVQLSYHGSERRIDPYRLEFQRGRWYLSGHDHSHGEDRSFRLDRIDGPVVLLDEPPFERPPDPPSPGARGAWELGAEEALHARVLFDADVAPWALQHVGPDRLVEERDDGAVVVELPVTNRAAFRSFVLGFLDHAEVLEPPELREDLVAWLTELAR